MNEKELVIEVDDIAASARDFSGLFQRGVGIRIRPGASIRDFLVNGLGLNEEYIGDKVKTVFLDSSPVDDLDTAKLTDGSVLALSGAMPGLVGAVMRVGSVLSPFRESISHRDRRDPETGGGGLITLKLFNVLLKDLPVRLLETGVLAPGKLLIDYFKDMDAGILAGFKSISYNGRKVDAPGIILHDEFAGSGLVRLLLKVAA